MRKIYLDSAATTYCNYEVIQEMMPCFDMIYGNTSSLHSFGREASNLLDNARGIIANSINAKSSEIYFTSSGSEANNLAIKGLARANKEKGRHIIATSIEHKSVIDACSDLEKEGFEVTYLEVDEKGRVSIGDLIHSLRPDTILVSIMMVNNELGTIQNLKDLLQIIKQKDIIFHTDAVCAYSVLDINVQELPIDAMTISAHKIYGPKGAGCLYVKKGVKIDSIISGGNHENGKRAGTVNLPSVVGFAKAAEIALRDKNAIIKKIAGLKDYFIKQLQTEISDIKVNGHSTQRIPNIASITFPGVNAQALMVLLDLNGIACSLGSACNSGSIEPSYVLKAIGLDLISQKSTLRFSFSKNLTKEDLKYAVDKIVECVNKLREVSPKVKK